MQEQVALGVLAVAIGGVVGVIAFVPFVAVSYRRRGGLGFGRFVLWAAALVYFWAIWTYTLLPLPDPDAIRCASVNLDVLGFVDDIRGAVARPGDTITDPAVLQLLLNVLLFVPLGFFLRVLGGRGILVALLVGLGLSAFIETTQLTGVWGLYPCAYRVFDVDDLLTNTTGAVLGSIVSLVVPARFRGSPKADDADRARPVTRGRRFVGMACDVVAALLVLFGATVAVQLWLEYVAGDRTAVLDGGFASVAAPLTVVAVWLGLVLATGRSVGDHAVQLRYTGGPLPTWLARILRTAGGAAGWIALGLLPEDWALLAGAFFLAALILLFTTKSGRGLAGIVSGTRLVDARADEREPTSSPV